MWKHQVEEFLAYILINNSPWGLGKSRGMVEAVQAVGSSADWRSTPGIYAVKFSVLTKCRWKIEMMIQGRVKELCHLGLLKRCCLLSGWGQTFLLLLVECNSNFFFPLYLIWLVVLQQVMESIPMLLLLRGCLFQGHPNCTTSKDNPLLKAALNSSSVTLWEPKFILYFPDLL